MTNINLLILNENGQLEINFELLIDEGFPIDFLDNVKKVLRNREILKVDKFVAYGNYSLFVKTKSNYYDFSYVSNKFHYDKISIDVIGLLERLGD